MKVILQSWIAFVALCRDSGTWDRYPAECKLFAFNSYLPKDEVNKVFV